MGNSLKDLGGPRDACPRKNAPRRHDRLFAVLRLSGAPDRGDPLLSTRSRSRSRSRYPILISGTGTGTGTEQETLPNHNRGPGLRQQTPRAYRARISDALSTLSDRGLRRLLGARTFLRGLEYFRRRVVDDISVNDVNASGTVRAADSEPYPVAVELTPDGIQSQCSCPAFSRGASTASTSRPCSSACATRHADPSRGARRPCPRRRCRSPPTPAGATHEAGATARPAIPAPAAMPGPGGAVPAGVSQGVAAKGPPGSGVTWRRSRVHGRRNRTADGHRRVAAPRRHRGPRRVEFRLHVRQGALTVTVLDAEARVPILPSVALAWQSLYPTPDRDALRRLARFESGNPRHPAVDVRGRTWPSCCRSSRGSASCSSRR